MWKGQRSRCARRYDCCRCSPSYDWMRSLSVKHPSSCVIRSSSSSSNSGGGGGTSGAGGSSGSMLSRHCSTAATRRVTLVFNNLQPAELAEQLTFLEYKAFRRITVSQSPPPRPHQARVRSNSTGSICCGSVVKSIVEQIHAIWTGPRCLLECLCLSRCTRPTVRPTKVHPCCCYATASGVGDRPILHI